MFENFSAGSRETMLKSQNLARQLGHRAISSGHFLVVMLEEIPAEDDLDFSRHILKENRVSAEKTRERLVNMLGNSGQPVYGRVPLSPGATRMILSGEKERVRGRSSQLYDHHLLLGALADGKCRAGLLLRREGVTLIKAREFVAQCSTILADILKESQVTHLRR